jgi:hypothetical protein
MEAASPEDRAGGLFLHPDGANNEGDILVKRSILTMIVLGMLIAVVQAYAAPGGKGGSGKGGFGELGNGCVTFLSPQGDGFIYDDYSDSLKTNYCNGSDAQVSVPVRLRLDMSKFNKKHRYFWIDGDCNSATGDTTQALCKQGVEGLRMGLSLDTNGDDWDWTEMSVSDGLKEATMGVKIDNNHFLYFDPRTGGFCDTDGLGSIEAAGPVFVRCDGDTKVNGIVDGKCDMWTISTDPDFPDSTFDNASSACFKSGAYGDFYNSDVTANFTIEVCVMGVSCP